MPAQYEGAGKPVFICPQEVDSKSWGGSVLEAESSLGGMGAVGKHHSCMVMDFIPWLAEGFPTDRNLTNKIRVADLHGNF